MQNTKSPVTLADDSDIVRALGLVTMHFAHLEQVLNDCLDLSSTYHNYETLTKKYPRTKYPGFETRRRHLRSFFNRCSGETAHLRSADNFLKSCLYCARWRNRLVHGLIVSNPRRKTVELIESGNQENPLRLNSARVYEIAQRIRDTTRAGRKMRKLIESRRLVFAKHSQ